MIGRNIKQGSEIDLERLAKLLKVSPVNIKESITYLVNENVIEGVSEKSFFIKKYDKEDIFEIYSLRSVLEGLAIKLSARKASREQINQLEEIYQLMKVKLKDDSVGSLEYESSKIHDFISVMSGHDRLIKMYKIISLQVLIANSLSGSIYTKSQEITEHRELIGAIKSRDPDTAEDIMKNHIYKSYKKFIQDNDLYINAF